MPIKKHTRAPRSRPLKLGEITADELTPRERAAFDAVQAVLGGRTERLDGGRAQIRLPDGTAATLVTIVGTERGAAIDDFTVAHRPADFRSREDRCAFLRWWGLDSAAKIDALLMSIPLSQQQYQAVVEALRQAARFRRPEWYVKVMKAARAEGRALRAATASLRPVADLCDRLGLASLSTWDERASALARSYQPSEPTKRRLANERTTLDVPTASGEVATFTRTALDEFEIHYRAEAGSTFLDAYSGTESDAGPHVREALVTEGIVRLVDTLKPQLLLETRTFQRVADLLNAAGSTPNPGSQWGDQPRGRWTRHSVRSRYGHRSR